MVSSDEDGNDEGLQTRFEDDLADPDVDNLNGNIASNLANKRSVFDKNELRSRRSKLRKMSSVIPLDDEEISALSSAGMLMPDPYRLLLESDPISRLQMSENDPRRRVQYTNMLVPPTNVDELLKDDPKPVRMGSKEYLLGEKSAADLMVAVRSSAKVLSSFRVAYAEQYALHEELLRLVQERKVVSKMRRLAAPGYLIDFARLMEMLGCQRNHLRSADGRLVSIIKQHLGLDNDANDTDGDDEADYFKSWLAEENALAGDDSDSDANSEDIDEFDRLSRIAARALMDGDLVRAKSAFADLEAYDALIEGSFGADSIDDDDALDDDKIVSPGGGADAPLPVESISAVPANNPATEQSEALLLKPVRLMDWGERVAPDSDHGRVDGYGRIDNPDAFGGIVSMASGVPDVIPMWARKDRPRSTGLVLGLNDWYRFEVPAGNYALVHMPRKLPEFSPVTDNMFPPYIDIVRYGEEADFSLSEMQSMLKESDTLGGAKLSIRAIRFVVVKRYGKDDEDLVRFWAFLVLGRVFMDRIDILFPDGYFHGVIDAGAEQAGVGYFSIVRVRNDRKLSNKMRTPRFAPFDSLELVSSLDGLKL